MVEFELAACREADADLFLATADKQSLQRARAVCARCAVRLECLALALENPFNDGVWGGMTTLERAAFAKRARLGATES